MSKRGGVEQEPYMASATTASVRSCFRSCIASYPVEIGNDGLILIVTKVIISAPLSFRLGFFLFPLLLEVILFCEINEEMSRKCWSRRNTEEKISISVMSRGLLACHNNFFCNITLQLNSLFRKSVFRHQKSIYHSSSLPENSSISY